MKKIIVSSIIVAMALTFIVSIVIPVVSSIGSSSKGKTIDTSVIGTNSNGVSITEDQLEAFVDSQQAVTTELKAPLTAKFPLIDVDGVSVTKLDTNKYLVSSYVDSENSSGAMLRSTYTVTITLNHDSTFTYSGLSINQQ
jgi:hypothetical protein